MFRKSCKLFKCCNFIQKIQKRLVANNVEILINGKKVSVPSYFTVIQALRSEKVACPSFCYHERLSIAGNCRMCLVQIEGWIKPQIACALNVSKGMKIRTNSEIAMRAQEGVLEFILVNHPLDCPICDQGGECDLQDLAYKYGNDRTRFTDIHFEGKRAQEDKNLGPLIRTEMTRCIQCTRCIRFGSQICGLDVLGTTGRSNDMLVGTYVEKMFLSELSGNIVDLCPVGALTAIPYMFKARPWEVKRTNSIDVTDAVGSNIELNYRFDRVLRILPREHDEVNQEWISDKARWAIDSVDVQRLTVPMFRGECSLASTTWDDALRKAAKFLCETKPKDIFLIAGPHCNAETLVVAKDFLNILGCESCYVERAFNHTFADSDLRTAYSMNIRLRDIAKADKIFFVGTNPRFEAPILNMWIRQAYRTNECDIFAIGPKCDYNYHVTYMGEGDSPKAFDEIAKIITSSKKPLIFVGADVLCSADAGHIMWKLASIASSHVVGPEWGVLNVITKEASFGAALECGYKTGGMSRLLSDGAKLVISLGADTVFEGQSGVKAAVIYIGFQGDSGAAAASVVLPGSAYTEAGGTYINMEGRVQFALPAVTPPGKARHDWKILRALAEYTGVCLAYSDLNGLHCRMAQISPNFAVLDQYQCKIFPDMLKSIMFSNKPTGEPIQVQMKTLVDYYCSDVFSMNSPTMARATKAAQDYLKSAYARN